MYKLQLLLITSLFLGGCSIIQNPEEIADTKTSIYDAAPLFVASLKTTTDTVRLIIDSTTFPENMEYSICAGLKKDIDSRSWTKYSKSLPELINVASTAPGDSYTVQVRSRYVDNYYESEVQSFDFTVPPATLPTISIYPSFQSAKAGDTLIFFLRAEGVTSVVIGGEYILSSLLPSGFTLVNTEVVKDTTGFLNQNKGDFFFSNKLAHNYKDATHSYFKNSFGILGGYAIGSGNILKITIVVGATGTAFTEFGLSSALLRTYDNQSVNVQVRSAVLIQ